MRTAGDDVSTPPSGSAGPPEGRAASIDSLPLSNRTRSRLREAGIDSAERLHALSDQELLALPGFGHTCLREVRELLGALRSGREPMVVPGDEEFPADVPAALQATPLARLPISNRARRVFEREGLVTIEDYLRCGADRLLRLRSFGETTYFGVNRAIRAACRGAAGGAAADLERFQVGNLLGAAGKLDDALGRLPIATLDLPRRARRACQELGLRTLRELAAMSADDLLLRRNFGQATLRRIQAEVERFVVRRESERPDDFASLVENLFSRLQPKERRLVELREGRLGPPRTLTEAGQALEITESRACQIEHAAWAKLRRFAAGTTDAAGDAATAALLRHSGVAPPDALLEAKYFATSGLPLTFVARILGRLLPHRLALLADGRLAAAPAATLSSLASRLRRRLNRSNASQPLDRLAADVLRGLDLDERGAVLVRALCETLFHREVTRDQGGGEVVRTSAQGLCDDLVHVLREAGRPLHFSEVARRLQQPPFLRDDLGEEKVRLRLCRDSRFVLVRRGLYDLRERFHVAPELRAALVEHALEILRSSARPTSVALLALELRREERFRDVNEFLLSRVLRDDRRVAYLGRGSFVPAAAAKRSGTVGHVSAILEEILEAEGGPLPYAELRRRVQERRQVSDGAISATLVGRDTFLRIERGHFDLARRHPYDGERRQAVARSCAAQLDAAGGILPLAELTACFDPQLAGGGAPPTPVLLGDLLRRHGGFRFFGGGFVATEATSLDDTLAQRAAAVLEQSGEALRPSALARRLGLGPAETALLRHVVRERREFRLLGDGRVALGAR